jgi:predicted lipid-binding transport protein (Tim44 family)
MQGFAGSVARAFFIQVALIFVYSATTFTLSGVFQYKNTSLVPYKELHTMKKQALKIFTLLAAVLFLSATVMEFEAHARAGSGSRSMGSAGSRSYSRPASPSYQPPPPRPQQAAPSPIQQPAAGGFMRSMAGGIAGGLLGGMLFRSLGFGGMGGGMGGGGIGLFEIILIAGIGYLIYRFIKKNRETSSMNTFEPQYGGGTVTPISQGYQNRVPEVEDVETGLAHIRQFDPYFDENSYNDLVMDNFFKIQGAWMNRDLTPVQALLTDEMRRIFQTDIDKLIRDKQINRLENIAVRNVEIVEAWQESGQDYINTLVYANLLDYTTDETGTVLSGSKSDPVKFEEYWTFTRPVGNNPWKLTKIDQK